MPTHLAIAVVTLITIMIGAPAVATIFGQRKEWHVSRSHRIIVTTATLTTLIAWAIPNVIIGYRIAQAPPGTNLGNMVVGIFIMFIMGAVACWIAFKGLEYTVNESAKPMPDNVRHLRRAN